MRTVLAFGKHKGRTLPEVLLHDPGWFFWAAENGVFLTRPRLAIEAATLEFKARNIKIPKPDPENWCVEYFPDLQGNFVDFRIVEKEGAWSSSGVLFRDDCFDLSIPQQLKRCGKLGRRMMLKRFKSLFFGAENARLTKKRCEEFFDDPKNFVRL